MSPRTTAAVGDDAPATLDRDAVFDLLSSSRRRHVLAVLCETTDGVSLKELARQIAALETDTAAADLDDDAVHRVYISLYQTHVPKFEEHDVLRFDADTQSVHLLASDDDLRPICRLLDVRRPTDDSPTTLVGVWAVVAAVAVTLLGNGALVVASGSPALLAAFVLLAGANLVVVAWLVARRLDLSRGALSPRHS